MYFFKYKLEKIQQLYKKSTCAKLKYLIQNDQKELNITHRII